MQIWNRGVLMEIALQLIVNGLLIGGVYALISVGLTLIFGVMNIINFAHGDFLMIAMYMVYWLNRLLGMDPYVALIIVVPIMFLIGLGIYKLNLNPIIGKQELLTILMTVGIMIFLQNLALMLFNADVRGCIPYSYSTIGTEYVRMGVTKVASFALAIIAAIFLLLLLDKTWIGKSIKATSQNAEAAKLMGIDTRKTYMIAFAIGIATVGAAGVALAPIYSIHPQCRRTVWHPLLRRRCPGRSGKRYRRSCGRPYHRTYQRGEQFLLPSGYTEQYTFSSSSLCCCSSLTAYLVGRGQEVEGNGASEKPL